ncbi:GNAT family N-acetyltransferase [Lichenihabitans psoromatis]|uniref:GNAT family N-acetyltransferase n=1 Tax=Lichenihabitans psoromatis TaxID=2528642 RepID=UPI0010385D6F|nr:GNAT family N-acetyltransferase [Lichenihabitans psoromatis]
MPDLVLRPALPGDADLIFAFVSELAAYEKLSHAVVSTPAVLAEALFGPSPRVFCDIATWGGAPAGFALWFYDFSTFEGRHGIYLEDLFVRPAFRGHKIGKRLMAGLAARCRAERLGRLTWSVLDWNAPSIDFYKAQGAVMLDDWTTCRLTGDALLALGDGARRGGGAA